MLPTALIVFREVLEAALIVSIVLAASQGVRGRGLWVGGGILGGILSAGIVALFAREIAGAVAGMGQELFNAAVLFTAVFMLGWHNVWMQRHGRELAAEATSVGKAVLAGTRPLYALALVVGLAVLREGSELVLFLYSIAAANGTDHVAFAGGAFIGLAAGVAIGAALYFGLLRIPLHRLFQVTSVLILLLAAGMAAQGAAFLVQADMLPSLGETVWDTSAFLSESSIPGQVLHALIGYVSRPAGIQLLAYAATLLIVGVLMRRFGGTRGRPSSTRVAPHAAE